MRMGGRLLLSRPMVARLLALAGIFAAALLAGKVVPTDWGLIVHLGLIAALVIYVAALVERVRNAGLVAVSALLCLGVFEAYALIEYPRPINIFTPGLWNPRAELGWGATHPGVIHHTEIDAKTGRLIVEVDYTIDEHLNRKVDSAPSGPAIAFFGDSLTFGSGLPDADTLPQAFADATGRVIRILDLGFPGYGPQQFLRALEAGLYGDLLKPSRLFVFQTAAWHAERSSCIADFMKHAARYRLSGGRPELAGTCTRWWSALTRSLFTGSATYRAFVAPLVERVRPADIELYLAIIERAAALARERYGVPTAILYLPDDDYAGRTGVSDDEIMQRLRDHGLIVINGALDQSAFLAEPLTIPGDGHPTGVANRARAVLLRDAVRYLLAEAP
jgi:hypothetical protein